MPSKIRLKKLSTINLGALLCAVVIVSQIITKLKTGLIIKGYNRLVLKLLTINDTEYY